MLPIEERLLPQGEQTNRPGTELQPRGLVVHSTANPGVGAEAHYHYWASGRRGTSVHLVVDWEKALTIIPWQPGRAEQAWHAGAEANRCFIGLEICESQNAELADRSWTNAAAVAAQVLQAYGWGSERLLSHAQVTAWYGGTTHLDPLPYFSRWNRTWADFLVTVDRVLRGEEPWLPAPAPSLPPQPGRQAVRILDVAGRELAEGWLEGNHTAVLLRPLAQSMGLAVDWEPAGPAVTLRWPGPEAAAAPDKPTGDE